MAIVYTYTFTAIRVIPWWVVLPVFAAIALVAFLLIVLVAGRRP